nr:hypothetical protein CFP56_34294 [Quercus suber]
MAREESPGSARNNGAIAREESTRSATDCGAIAREELTRNARDYGAIEMLETMELLQEIRNKKGRRATRNLKFAEFFAKERFPIIWQKGRPIEKYFTVFKLECIALVRRNGMLHC